MHNSEQVESKIDSAGLIDELCSIVSSDSVLFEKEDLKPYECDGLSAYRAIPIVVVLPETIEQVQKVLGLCHLYHVPVVARGAGTGLSGGALPHEQGVLLSLAKFKNILEINPERRIARVQPGVRNLAISEAADHFGLYYAPDPSSQIACTIGGNVAENSGGVHCLKYGLTVHNIQQIKIITIEGEILTIGGSGLDSAGYDLLALMTGSEGMLGVIVEVTVKLLPKPERAQVLLAAFDDVVKAGEAVGNIIAAGIIPAGLEMMDRLAISAAEDFVHAGYPLDAEAILLCELDGTNEEVSEHVLKVRDVFKTAALQKCAPRKMKTSGSLSGKDAKPHSLPWADCHPIITAWMAPYRASNYPKYWNPSLPYPKSMSCRLRMFFTPATVTCTR